MLICSEPYSKPFPPCFPGFHTGSCSHPFFKSTQRFYFKIFIVIANHMRPKQTPILVGHFILTKFAMTRSCRHIIFIPTFNQNFFGHFICNDIFSDMRHFLVLSREKARFLLSLQTFSIIITLFHILLHNLPTITKKNFCFQQSFVRLLFFIFIKLLKISLRFSLSSFFILPADLYVQLCAFIVS